MFTIIDRIVGEIVECPTVEVATTIFNERMAEYEGINILIAVRRKANNVVELIEATGDILN